MKRRVDPNRREFLALGGASVAALAVRADEPGDALRVKLANDRNRPQYHIVPPAHFLNDPNGPLYWQGQYHTFYQYAPGGGMFSKKFWYHVVSDDMVHWRNLGVALAPTPGGPDKDGCWSGSAVVHNGVPTLVYTGAFFKGENERADRANGLIPERQMLAVAADPNDPDLRKWNKIAEDPVIAAPPEGMTVTGWRDPSLWKEGDTWYMVIGSRVHGVGGMALLYRSRDLRKWEYLHPFATAKPNPALPGGGAMWECPDFFYLGGKPVLMVAAGNRYLTGNCRDLKFEQETEGRIDYGSAYAQKTMADAQGRRIWWAWVTEGPGASRDAGWSGAISLPRVLFLAGDGKSLNIEPAPELRSLRAKRHAIQKVTVAENSPRPLSGVPGDCVEIVAEIDPGTATQVGLRVRKTPDGSEQMLIGYDSTDGTLFSDTSQSNKNAPTPSTTMGSRWVSLKKGALHLAEREPLRLQVFLDASVVETFANRRVGIIDRVYPSNPDAFGIEVFARGGSAVVHSLEAWELRPISNDRLTSGPIM